MFKSYASRCAGLALACCIPWLCAEAQGSAPARQNPELTTRNPRENPAPPPADSKPVSDEQKYITREFGPGFKLVKTFPVLYGDLDGDGVEDAVFVVTGGSPMLSAGAFNYTVIDPYDGYWSFADPSLNAHVTQTDPGPHYYLLLSHDWRGEHPKMKFVIFNLPFKEISLTPTTMGGGSYKKGKKIVAAIATVERDGQQGAVIWNGKQYKFVQLGNSEE
jgi:hypothetical protein